MAQPSTTNCTAWSGVAPGVRAARPARWPPAEKPMSPMRWAPLARRRLISARSASSGTGWRERVAEHAGANADPTEPAGYGLGLVDGVLGVAAAGQDDHVDTASASGGCRHWLVRFSALVTESVMRAANWSGISSQAKWLAGRIVSLLPGIRWARYSPLDTGTRGSSAEAKTWTGTWIPGSRSRSTGSCSG